MKQQLTKSIIYAAATNANARKRKQPRWDDEAIDAYHAVFDRLFALIGGAEGWIDLPR